MSSANVNNPQRLERDHLVILDPSGRRMLYEFRGPSLSIGRSAENDIVLPSTNISRVHLTMQNVHDGWQLIDSGGISGTYAGPRRLAPNAPHMLRPLEVVSIGEYSFYWQPVNRHPHGWHVAPDIDDEEVFEDTPYTGSTFSGWYVVSAFVTLFILLVGIWFILQIVPGQQLTGSFAQQTPSPSELWEGEWQTECEWLPCGSISLDQTEEGVVGHYLNGTGSLHGVVDGDRLVGVWLLGGASGTFEFTMAEQANAPNAFVGHWDDTWQWCGVREGGTLPANCLAQVEP